MRNRIKMVKVYYIPNDSNSIAVELINGEFGVVEVKDFCSYLSKTKELPVHFSISKHVKFEELVEFQEELPNQFAFQISSVFDDSGSFEELASRCEALASEFRHKAANGWEITQNEDDYIFGEIPIKTCNTDAPTKG